MKLPLWINNLLLAGVLGCLIWMGLSAQADRRAASEYELDNIRIAQLESHLHDLTPQEKAEYKRRIERRAERIQN